MKALLPDPWHVTGHHCRFVQAGQKLRRPQSSPALQPLILLLVTLLALGAGLRTRADDVRRVSLPDGVRLLLKPEPGAELTAISICVRTGPDRAPLDDAAADIVARSLFTSSFNRSREGIAASIARVGGSIETTRCADHVKITCVTLPSQVREAVYLLCEVLKNSDFAGVDRIRAVLAAEQREQTHSFLGGLEAVRRALQARPDFADLPYQRITSRIASDYFQSRYVAEHTVIAVVGQFDAEGIQTALRDSLADFDRHSTRRERDEPLYSHATNTPTRTLSCPGASATALVALAAPAVGSADFAPFVVLESILGEGHASRLFQRLRDSQGIGYSVGAVWQPGLSDPLIAYLQWEAKASGARISPDEALKMVNAQIEGLVKDPPTQAEVDRAVRLAIGRESMKHERVRDRAGLLAWAEAMGGGYAFDAALLTRLNTVTRDDVLRVARQYLTPRASALITPAP